MVAWRYKLEQRKYAATVLLFTLKRNYAATLRAAVKVTVNALAGSCQLFHCKTYGNILQCI